MSELWETSIQESTLSEKITVRLLCEKAVVNRSTFYAHYTDIFDMIEQMETSLRAKLMDNYPVPGYVTPLSLESFIPFLKFIHEHRDFYRIALKTRKEFPLYGKTDKIDNSALSLCGQLSLAFPGFRGYNLILEKIFHIMMKASNGFDAMIPTED